MATSSETGEQLPAHLSVWDAVSIIIGVVIGTSIYQTVPFILGDLNGLTSVLIVWAVAGGLSLVGALCYAELATTYPQPGGDFVYLTRAYGRWMGFLFGWAQLAVVLTANIGMMTYVFADYAARLFGLSKGYGWMWAGGAVVVLTFLNLLGVQAGKRTQNVLTVTKIVGLLAIVVVGLAWPATAEQAAAPIKDQFNLAGAMVLIMLAYGGWNDAAFVAAEVRDRKRGIPRALIFGIIAITLIYLLLNFAYINALGYTQASQSEAIAADVLAKPLQAYGEKAMCVLVMISALGAANGLIFTGARVAMTLGREHAIFAWLGGWQGRRGVPFVALLAQAIISLAMIAMVGSTVGQGMLTRLFTLISSFASLEFNHDDLVGKDGFTTLLRCTVPVFWSFFLLTGLSLFILREQQKLDSKRDRPFSVPFYPYLPLLFCCSCAFMLHSGIKYAGAFGLVGATMVLIGLPLYEISERMGGRRAATNDGESPRSPNAQFDGQSPGQPIAKTSSITRRD